MYHPLWGRAKHWLGCGNPQPCTAHTPALALIPTTFPKTVMKDRAGIAAERIMPGKCLFFPVFILE